MGSDLSGEKRGAVFHTCEVGTKPNARQQKSSPQAAFFASEDWD